RPEARRLGRREQPGLWRPLPRRAGLPLLRGAAGMRHRTLTWRGRALPIEGAPLGPGRGISIVSSTGRPMNGELYDGDRYLGVVFAWQAHAVLLPGDYGQQMP